MTYPTRKLAAIVFTDIVGYTSLSSRDEQAAFDLIQRQRDLLRPIVEKFQGRWLKEVGDGVLLSFPSSIQAVRCAIKIQKTVKQVKDLNLRIGIHQGDILEEGGDVFGDDVNIASRLEPFSAPGGIVISGKVQQDISSNPEFTTKHVGRPKLKGIRQEVEIYCLTSDGLPETKLSLVRAKLERRPVFWIKWAVPTAVILAGIFFYVITGEREVPSVGILHMENLGGEEDEFWARGITEDVIIDVASSGLIRVSPMQDIMRVLGSEMPIIELAKILRVKYLLTSSIHKRNGIFDLRCQLIDAESGKSIYANKWSEPLVRASTITTTLAQDILTNLGISPKQPMTKAVAVNSEAYALYLKGKYQWLKRKSQQDVEVALQLLEEAITLDPSLLIAKLQIGHSLRETGAYNRAIDIFQRCLAQSISLKDRSSEARAIKGLGDTYLSRGENKEALQQYERALVLARDLGDRLTSGRILRNMGGAYYNKGDLEQAANYYRESMDIARELEDRRGEGETRYNLGNLYYELDDEVKAADDYQQALTIFRGLGEKSRELYPLMGLGLIQLERGAFQAAMNYLAESLEIARETGDKRGEFYGLLYYGDILYQKGDNDKATEYYHQSLRNAKAMDDEYLEGLAQQSLGKVMIRAGAAAQAGAYFESACDIWRRFADRALHAKGLSWWALAAFKAGALELALSKANQTESILVEITAKDTKTISERWNLFQVYSGLDSTDKAWHHLVHAQAGVLARADRYTNPMERRRLLDNIPMYREILETYKELAPS